jgi:hypothetical protein
MAMLPCADDALTKMLNVRGLQPLAMPQTNLVAPELWVFDNTSLVRWGPLANFVARPAARVSPALVRFSTPPCAASA